MSPLVPWRSRWAVIVDSISLPLFLRIGRWVLLLSLAGCSWVDSDVRPEVPESERPVVAVLGFGTEVEITKLSSIMTVTEELSPDREAQLVADELRRIREEARRLLHHRLEQGGRFKVMSLEETFAAARDLGLKQGGAITSDQLAALRARLHVDVVVTGTILDYGKVRWKWAAAGMLGDLTWETVVIGLASAWNPAIILGNVGFELLTGTPVWFGGAYLVGVAFRPVRVEAQAVDSRNGELVWNETEVAVYIWGRLKELPEAERSRKEIQLRLNLQKAVEALGDSLLDAGLTNRTLWERRLPEQNLVSF